MSLEQLRRVWPIPGLAPLQRLLLLALADCANDDGGSCYPSQTTLARLTGISPRHLQTVLRELLASGLVKRERVATGSTSASYRLLLPQDLQQPQRGNGSQVAMAATLSKPALMANDANSHAATATDPSESLRDPKNAGAPARESARAAWQRKQPGNGTGNGRVPDLARESTDPDVRIRAIEAEMIARRKRTDL